MCTDTSDIPWLDCYVMGFFNALFSYILHIMLKDIHLSELPTRQVFHAHRQNSITTACWSLFGALSCRFIVTCFIVIFKKDKSIEIISISYVIFLLLHLIELMTLKT